MARKSEKPKASLEERYTIKLMRERLAYGQNRCHGDSQQKRLDTTFALLALHAT